MQSISHSKYGHPKYFCDKGAISGNGSLRANLQESMAFGKWGGKKQTNKKKQPSWLNQIVLFMTKFYRKS